MRQRTFRLLLIGMFVMSLFGCRTIHHYEYEYVELPVLGGELSVVVNTSYGEPYEKEGKKMIDNGFPYFISFNLDVFGRDKLHKLIIKNIELVGEETGRRSRLQDIQTDRVRFYKESKEHVGKKYLRVSTGPLVAEQHEHENYTLRATVVVYRDETHYESEEITIQLVTKYWKEYTNDSFDAFMNV